ncbi:ABC transporter permease [Dyella jiangningensis]|jgi:phospholipid/cholesterol/gamma-HCH transport system substrate-binding protein|uniref:MlaD family protein n=1 Tax=Dyella jiangningensis TaxID=1379159 RepID=UPI0004566960|nr:MlaD family protein [Dyella jiangningensis]AHX12043.1 ABC transporter permease [Dyella jiangningensis]AHX15989.1 ABC transporter permease [Dyella jiangningensis]MDG2539390.1 MlaD family protein [Dyella jiangningensis]
METRAHHVLIGLFTVIVVAAAMLFGLWLAKSSSDREFAYYQVVFNEAVTGLSQGSAVNYNGIKVGDVTQLKLDKQDPRKVLALIRLGGDTPVRQDTHAKLALTGVTGLAVIQLSGGSPGSPPLEGKNGNLPVIVADPSPLSRILANGEDLVMNINDVVARASALLSPENMDRIGRTLDHLDKATGAIADQRDDIRTLLKQLAEASKQANDTLAQTQKLVQSANGLVDNQGKATLDSARNALASVERVTANIDRLVNDNRASINGGMQGFSELAPAIRELRDAAGSLRGVARRLDDNPTGFLLGRDRSKEFVP